jgi:transcription antitermination factor NusG
MVFFFSVSSDQACCSGSYIISSPHIIINIIMRTFKEGWYLIYTRPWHEKKVHTRLAEIDIVSFLPLIRRLRTCRDKRRAVDEPLFPSYVFVYLKNMQHYYNGIDTDGALYYVKMNKEIVRVKDSIVDNIKLAVNQTSDLEVSAAHFQPGRKLVINKGPLTGLSCEVVQLDQKEKLLVRVDLLQRNLLLSLPKDYLMIS